jgi:16S rRNA processing protein RimM
VPGPSGSAERRPARPELLEVGQVVRPHGLGGQVVVELWTNLPERMAAGTVLESAAGRLEVRLATPMPPGRRWPRWLVSFAGFDGREAAEGLRGRVLLAAPLDVEQALWIHEMVGSAVYEGGVRIGCVAAVEANPASDLLVLDDGTLIPLHFVTASSPGRLTVALPDGLLDL